MGRKQSENKYIRKKQDGLFSKKIVRQVLLTVNVTTAFVLFISWRSGGADLGNIYHEWMSFFKVEVLALAGITATKSSMEAVKFFATMKHTDVGNSCENEEDIYG